MRIAGVDAPELSGSMTDIYNKGQLIPNGSGAEGSSSSTASTTGSGSVHAGGNNGLSNSGSSSTSNNGGASGAGGGGVGGGISISPSNKGQPFAMEAKNFVRSEILNQKVELKLLRKDQYSRAVCSIKYGPWYDRKDLAEELVKKGYAVVYREGGAVYDGNKVKLEKLELGAKRKKLGLWSQKGHIEKPSDYKQAKNSGVKTQAFYGKKAGSK